MLCFSVELWYTVPVMVDTRKKSHTRFALFALCLTVLCAVLWAIPKNGTAAAEETAAVVLKHDTACAYRYFDYPTAVYADENGFAVADGATAYLFGSDGTERPDTLALPGAANKLVLRGHTPIALSGGTLYVGETALGEYADFTVYGNTLYAVRGGTVYGFDLDGFAVDPNEPDDAQTVPSGTQAITYSKTIKKIAADHTGLYATVQNDYNAYTDDVVFFSAAEESKRGAVLLTQSDEILGLATRGSGGVVCLTRGNIVAYLPAGNMLTQAGKLSGVDAVTIAVSGDTVYGITQLKSVFRVNAALSVRTELLASAHTETGFFYANAGIASRKQTVAVADERNNRVQLIDENGTTVLDATLTAPKAVVIGYAGNLFVAHDRGTISVFDSGHKFVRSFSAPGEHTVITDLQTDADNNLYALSSEGQIYKIAAGGETFAAIGNPGNRALTIGRIDNAVYAATDTTVDVIESDGRQKVLFSFENTLSNGVADLCSDYDNAFYLLGKDGIVYKYEKLSMYAVTEQKDLGLIDGTKIILNAVTFTGKVRASFGDLLISDTGAHAVKVVPGEWLHVKTPALDAPADIDDLSPATGDEIIYVMQACDVYAQAAEINEVAHLKDNTKVIIPAFEEGKPFQLILTDDPRGYEADPIIGYVYTSLITKRLPYAAAPSQDCYSYSPSMDIYPYPSLNTAPAHAVQRNEKLALLSFAYTEDKYGYTDNFPTKNTWYRVSYEKDGERHIGYVIADSISMRGENPDDRNVYPRVNAKIISKEKGKNLPATLYEKIDGQFVPITDTAYKPLDVGTEVEVIDSFDSSEKYTLIRYYHEGIGTVQCYVETANLEYDGVNTVVIVAVVIIIVTVILGAVLVTRVVYVKRTRKLSKETKL